MGFYCFRLCTILAAWGIHVMTTHTNRKGVLGESKIARERQGQVSHPNLYYAPSRGQYPQLQAPTES
jgi:hypothetical protein